MVRSSNKQSQTRSTKAWRQTKRKEPPFFKPFVIARHFSGTACLPKQQVSGCRGVTKRRKGLTTHTFPNNNKLLPTLYLFRVMTHQRCDRASRTFLHLLLLAVSFLITCCYGHEESMVGSSFHGHHSHTNNQGKTKKRSKNLHIIRCAVVCADPSPPRPCPPHRSSSCFSSQSIQTTHMAIFYPKLK